MLVQWQCFAHMTRDFHASTICYTRLVFDLSLLFTLQEIYHNHGLQSVLVAAVYDTAALRTLAF